MVAALRRRFDDDDDVFDSEIYDPKFPGQRVIRDGKGIRVPIFLTDGQAPEWMRSLHRNDASLHRPHQLGVGVTDSAELRDAKREAEDAYQARNFQLENSWRGPATPVLPELADGDDARADYIKRITSAYRTPTGRNDPAEASASSASDIAALQRRWASPGATPGLGRRATQDAPASRVEADQAYAEYCARLQSAWKIR